MKRILAYLIIILFYFVSNMCASILNVVAVDNKVILIICSACIFIISIGLSYAAFYIAEKIEASEKGLRYKVFSIFIVFVAVTQGIGGFVALYPNVEIIDIFLSISLLLPFALALFNPTLAFGITQFYLYRKRYSDNQICKTME